MGLTKKTNKVDHDGAAAPLTILRPLGHFERYMEADYYWGYLSGNSVSCRYNFPEALSDPRERLFQSLALTVLEHPMLQAVLVDADKKAPKFARPESVKLDELTTWHVIPSSEDYNVATDRIVNEQIDKDFGDGRLLQGWRVVITKPEQFNFMDVHLMVRHTMFDGESRKIFHASLLNRLNNPREDQLSSLFEEGHTLRLQNRDQPFPPPMEKFGQFKMDLDFVASKTWLELKPSFFQTPSATQKSWGPFKTTDCATERRTVRIDRDKTQKIVEVCRSHETTVTGLIHGIIFASLLWSCKDTVQSQSFVASTAVNLRRFMPSRPRTMPGIDMDPNKTISNMLTVIEHKYDEKRTNSLLNLVEGSKQGHSDCRHLGEIVWAVAKSSREDIQGKLEQRLQNDVMELMKLIPDWRSEKKRSGKKARYESWSVTNLGIFDGKHPQDSQERSGWSIGHAVFAPSVDSARSLFVISAISAKGGDMCIGLAWQKGLSKYIDDTGDRLTRDLNSWFNYVVTSEWLDDWLQKPFA